MNNLIHDNYLNESDHGTSHYSGAGHINTWNPCHYSGNSTLYEVRYGPDIVMGGYGDGK